MASSTFDMYFLLRVAIWRFADFELVVTLDGSNLLDNERPRFTSNCSRNFIGTTLFRISCPLVPAHHCEFPRVHPNAPLELVGLVQHIARSSEN